MEFDKKKRKKEKKEKTQNRNKNGTQNPYTIAVVEPKAAVKNFSFIS